MKDKETENAIGQGPGSPQQMDHNNLKTFKTKFYEKEHKKMQRKARMALAAICHHY